ncbi:NAD(P)/FAD-dependent oxidoreductase [Phenylobacterium aquaticum]|uniref:FAD-dependent oxidoreductase n=1 Tax=Phenylobacterium aquaticum TaxID=1763816 RepID=UPI0026F32146|nr:FAD-dependent monooxygenase [Phenylobacterium aquaticum]
MADYDLIIVGGGIAGSALAQIMAAAGSSVLVLEASEVFEDRVRGEWIAPWGVKEVVRVGLYELLMGAGGHHVQTHVTYDESRSAEASEAEILPLSIFAEGIAGPLCLGHPRHCQTLMDAAVAAGARVVRGAQVSEIGAGAQPFAAWRDADGDHRATARLLVGADGRASFVRENLGVPLNQDPPHHMFAGLLVEGAEAWDATRQVIGAEGQFGFLAFPQGSGRVRLYGSYALDQRRRFSGADGTANFLAAFLAECAPANRILAEARPAGPLLSYFNNDAWTDQPFVEGAVLIGDAAGWNDPITGQGLSITYRDVRLVSEILRASSDWSAAALAPYGEERAERLRRLRFSAALTAALDAEFGPEAAERRRRHHERSAADPSLKAHAIAVMAGPEVLPPDVFTPEHWARVLEL